MRNVILNQSVIAKLLGLPSASDLISLYTIYKAFAIQDVVHLPVSDASDILKWGNKKTRRARTLLRDHGFIEDEAIRDPKDNRVTEWLVHLLQ